jgi:hypothetical protein
MAKSKFVKANEKIAEGAGRGKRKGSTGEGRAGSDPQTLNFSKETGEKYKREPHECVIIFRNL